jgi:hypothetical protein
LVPAGTRLDNYPEPPQTVILKLVQPPANRSACPPYLVGYPSRAAAVIVDSRCPRPLPYASVLPDRCLLVGSDAVDGAWYRVECSADLVDWVPVCTSQVVQGAIQFVYPEAPELPGRFYRAVPIATPPAE